MIKGFVLGSAVTAGVVIFATAYLTNGLPFVVGLAAVIGLPFVLMVGGVPA